MTAWTAFPYDNRPFRYTAASLKKKWPHLHVGDVEPWPADPAVVQAWCLFHAGEFQAACQTGLAAGPAGICVANKAQAIYAAYLETKEKTKLEMLLTVAQRAEGQQVMARTNPNAFYWQAYALGRYGQGISLPRALAQGLGGKVKAALETTLALAPRHADAHIALGAFHAEVIAKVGKLLGRTQGADTATGLQMFEQALSLSPGSAIGMIERANGLVMLEGDKRMQQAEALYADAAACAPLDATECLEVEMARTELAQ
jgi:hypothetical protein